MNDKPAFRIPIGARLLPGGIRARLFLLIALVLLPLLLLLGWIYLGNYRTRSTQAVLTELEVAQGIAMTFSAFVENIRRSSFAVGEAILTFDPYTREKANRILRVVAAQYHTLRGLNWVSPEGKVLASSQPELIGTDLSDRDYYRQIVAGRPWALGDLLPRGKDFAAPVFGVATAILNQDGEMSGMVVAGIDPDRLGALALTQQRFAGGAYAIFDSRGTVVYRLPGPPLTWEDRVRWRETDPLLEKTLQTGDVQFGIIRPEVPGGAWLSARVPISAIGWVAGTGRPLDVVLAPVRQRLGYDTALAVLIASAAFLLAWIVARSIVGPLRRLERDAEIMGAGQLRKLADPVAPDEVRRLRDSVAGMAEDLLRRTETLRRSEAKFRAVFEQAAVGMGRVSFTDARWTDVNEAFCRMLGYSAAEMRATAWPEMTHPQDVDLDLVPFRRMAAGDLESYSVEKRFIHKDGHHVWTRLTLSLVRDAQGRPDYEIAVIEDISERKEAEEELRRLTRDLERRVEERTAALTEANREMEAFSYTVSHDLRAPLRHITSFVELLQAGSGKGRGEQEKRYLQIIAEAGRRMETLIDDLLAFSRLGRTPLTRTAVDLRTLVEDVRRELAPETEGRRIEWKIEPLPRVQADPVLLRTAITNLLANALKYTRGRETAVIEIGCRPEGGDCVCRVRDNGAGFDMRYAHKLFGVFQRLHRAEEFEGTGIGLASVQRIIQRHGGRIWAEGEVGKGATFYFTLPTDSAPG